MARITTPSAAPVSPMSHDPKASLGPTHKGVFRKEGDYWRVGYDGIPIRLKNIRGFGYIAHLLRHPDTEFHVLDLYGGIASQREDEITHTINGSPQHDECLLFFFLLHLIEAGLAAHPFDLRDDAHHWIEFGGLLRAAPATPYSDL